jgi:hypothetical protein
LIAIAPIVSLYATNVFETPASELRWPLAIALATAAIVWLGLRWALRDASRAALLTSLAIVYFYTIVPAGEVIDRWAFRVHGTLWVWRPIHVWTPLVVGGESLACATFAYWVIRRSKPLTRLTRAANAFSIVLVFFPITDSARALWREPPRTDPVPVAFPTGATPAKRPDIYYIVLDGFARADVQQELFHHDLEPFLHHLEEKGFFVARRATSNYCQTPLSISSSLNSVYLNDLFPKTARAITPLGTMIRRNAVAQTLRRHGYQFNSFATGFAETECHSADRYMSPVAYVSAFHRMLLIGTPLWRLLPNPMEHDSYTLTRKRTLYAFDSLPQLARDGSPTFTFVHILAPHPPFIFGEDGEDVSPHHVRYFLNDGDIFQGHYARVNDYARDYRREVIFLVKALQGAVDRLLTESPEPPIIIIQSDHGSGLRWSSGSLELTDLRERLSILNAYHFPGREYTSLYDTISPVNSFRVLLNTFFGAQLPLLPDRSYFSTLGDPFDFHDVTDRVSSPIGKSRFDSSTEHAGRTMP